jgi:hypothetical protein
MNDKIVSTVKWLLLSAYLLIICIYVKRIINPELYYHLHQPPFLTAWHFLKSYLLYPGGPAEYISTFLEQFFYSAFGGSLIITLIGLLTFRLTYSFLNNIKERAANFYLAILPFIGIVILLHNYYFPFSTVVKVLFAFSAISLFQLTSRHNILKWIQLFLLSFLVYYFSGSAGFVIYITGIILLAINSAGLKQNSIFIIVSFAYGILMPLIAFKFIFSISPDYKYMDFLPNLPEFMKYKPGIIFYAFGFYIPIIIALITLGNNLKNEYLNNFRQKINQAIIEPLKMMINKLPIPQKFHALINVSILMILITALSFVSFKPVQNLHAKNIIAADYYCYKQQWADAVGIAVSDKEYNYNINFSFNRAIDNTGNFVDLFFTYPQLLGADILYPDKVEAGEITYMSSDYYFDLGYISEAQRWANEALVFFPYSPRAMERLVITHLINGDYAAAKKYLFLLDKNLVSGNFVKQFLPYINDTSLVAKDSLIRLKRILMPHNNQISANIENRLMDLLKVNNRNYKAYEHLQMVYMLQINLAKFAGNFSYAVANNLQYETFDDALLYFIAQTNASIKNYNVNPGSVEKLKAISNILLKHKRNKKASKQELERYYDTYFYYVLYNSPTHTSAHRRLRTKTDTAH